MFCFSSVGQVIILCQRIFFFVLYTRAYVGINYEKTKVEVPLRPLLGKQNKKAKEVYCA